LLLKPGEPVNNRPLLLASALSAALGVFSFFLPATPPQGKPIPFTLENIPVLLREAWQPFQQALGLLHERSFAVFFGISLLITLALAFYYSFTSLFLEQRVRVRPGNVGPLMTIGQWAEIFFLAG